MTSNVRLRRKTKRGGKPARRKNMKKPIRSLFALFAAAFLLAGCVPDKPTEIAANPDFVPGENIEMDFVQLHNDTLEYLASIEDGEPYVFVSNIDINGDGGAKQININASVADGTSEEDCRNFAEAVLRQLGDAANLQDPNFEAGSTDSFGGFFNSYDLHMTVVNDKDNSVIYSLDVPAGEQIPLDPDYEKYVEDWLHNQEVYQEHVVYGLDGKVVYDD